MVVEGFCIGDGTGRRLEIKDGVYTSVKEIDYKGNVILSGGFTDMQVNGYLGIDYSGPDLDIAGIRELVRHLMKSGTTRHVATIVTNSEERITENLRTIANAVKSDPAIAESIAGIHVEGPFISGKDGPRGAHDPKYVRKPDIEEVRRWQNAAQGLIKIITIAPEQENAAAFTKAATEMGIKVAIGHCEPADEQIEAMVQAGSGLCTHLGNGSSAFLPRLRNHIWKLLSDDRLMAGVISDGFHLPYSVLKAFYRTKGIDRLILVSDAAVLGGTQPGLSKWGDMDVEVCRDGHLVLAGTSFLAGAWHLLDWDIRVFCKATGAPLGQAIRAVTTNPLKCLGYSEDAGFVEGGRANLAAFTQGKDRLEIQACVLGKNEWERV